MNRLFKLLMVWAVPVLFLLQHARSAGVGPFEDEKDIGKINHAGSATLDASSNSIVIASGGENMWFTNDAFHFVWKRVSGDFKLSAAVEWLGSGGNAHRK